METKIETQISHGWKIQCLPSSPHSLPKLMELEDGVSCLKSIRKVFKKTTQTLKGTLGTQHPGGKKLPRDLPTPYLLTFIKLMQLKAPPWVVDIIPRQQLLWQYNRRLLWRINWCPDSCIASPEDLGALELATIDQLAGVTFKQQNGWWDGDLLWSSWIFFCFNFCLGRCKIVVSKNHESGAPNLEICLKAARFWIKK